MHEVILCDVPHTPSQDAQEIIQYLVSAGLAEWLPGQGNECLVYWRTPAEWGKLLMEFVHDKGLEDSVMTVYEIREGETTQRTEFHLIDKLVLLKSLKELPNAQTDAWPASVVCRVGLSWVLTSVAYGWGGGISHERRKRARVVEDSPEARPPEAFSPRADRFWRARERLH